MGFLDRVFKVISEADVLIEVIDARFSEETRNKEMERIVKNKNKKLIIAINKADLVSKKFALKTKKELAQDFPAIFVSSTKKQGISSLRRMLAIEAKNKKIKVGVLGYPNTGKSSVINALAGRKAARTSITAGFTRGEQLINLSKNIQLIDSPGIIPFEEKNEAMLALVAAKSPSQVKDVLGVGEKIIEILKEKNPEILKKKFGLIDLNKSPDELLEEIAFNKKKLLKQGIPDTNAVAKILLLEWQKGRIK